MVAQDVDQTALREFMIEMLQNLAPRDMNIQPRDTKLNEVLATPIGRRDFKVAVSTVISANGGKLGRWPRNWENMPVEDLIPHIFLDPRIMERS